MTQQEFEAYVRIYPKRLNIWYSDTAPYRVLGVSIPALTAPPNSRDISNYIETLNKITIPLTTGGSVRVSILTKIRQTVVDQSSNTGNSTYYICTVMPVEIAQPTGPLLTGIIGFSPSIIRGEFTNGSYDVLLGNVEESRTSNYIMQSDRFKIGTLDNPSYTGPINIELLLSTSASKADVQDSLYNDTGWVNARYEGTPTNKLKYGTTPAESGLVFKGAFYPKGISADQVKYQVSSSQAIYEDFFYSGQGTTPGPSGYSTLFQLTGSYGIPGVNDTYYSYYNGIYLKIPLTNSIIPPPLQAGDLITIGTPSAGGSELMKVVTAAAPTLWNTPLGTHALYYITVIRGYLGDPYLSTTYQAFPANANPPLIVLKSSLSTIYKVSGNKLQAVPEGKLVVKESGAVLKIDPYGVILQNL
jgi:hypothetical protein